MNEQTVPYLGEYNQFVRDYKSGTVTGEEVGILIARLAQYFSEYNLKLIIAERQVYITAKDIENRIDENTGKAITSSKAQTIICATDEYFEKEKIKAHVQNIEQFINALKSLQKGVLQEYANSNF